MYRGPGAPVDGPLHHYMFELYAVGTELDVKPSGDAFETRANVIKAIEGTFWRKRLWRRGRRRFFRAVVFLVFAVTQLTFGLHVSPFLELRREPGERSPGQAAMPIGAGLIAALSVFPR